jgi:hypothetical protein
MGKTMEIRIRQDNTEQVLQALDEKIERALESVGLLAEGYAKQLCPVDTGLLRNSITHALDGQSPATTTYHADNGDGSGSYSGIVPSNNDGKRSVCIGTNLEYSVFIENGHSRQAPNGFLGPAISNNSEQYKEVIKSELQSD